MRDLRRQALESHKTVSRKARSRIVSGASSKVNSPAASRANSRNPSRQPSDDEDASLSDDTAWSTNSIDDLLNSEDLPADAWRAELHTRIEQITNLKRSTTEGRTQSLNAFAHILMARYAYDDIEPRMGELLSSIMRSIKQETTHEEAVAALKALTVAIVTLDSDDIYDAVADTLKARIEHSDSIAVKVHAIYAYSIAAFYGGASESEMEDIMAFMLEIIESDGSSIEAHDDGSVVTAALEVWGLLATQLDDLEELTENAIEAVVDQLESADARVQIAAGDNIALMYEASHTPREDDEEVPEEEDDESEDEETTPDTVKMVKRYDVYRRTDQLLHTLNQLATISGQSISKKDKKTLHSSFVDIRNSVEKPGRGPKYSTAVNDETGRVYGGGRMKVKINRSVEVCIDKWWKLMRLNALRRVLQGGFTHHYDENEAVARSIPFSMSSSSR